MNAAPLKSGILCKCGRWSHRATRGLAVAGEPTCTAFIADERECPKCRRFFLLLFRVTFSPMVVTPLGLELLHHPTAEGMRQTLALFPELTSADVETIVAVAGGLSRARAA